MKKLFIITVIVILLLITSEKNTIPNEAIRFRIISSSDNINDVRIKEKILSEITPILKKFNTSSIISTRNSINNSIDVIKEKINNVIEKENYNKNIDVKFGMNYFPEKDYNGKKYNEGNYESLVIEIGESKGKNFWCVLYPPLCFNNNENDDIIYKSKIQEILYKIFN